MPYATQSDLVPLRLTSSELAQLTDDAGSNAVNPVVVTAALEEASGTVDSYCRSRYGTPLQPSDVVKASTLDITVYLLFSRRRNMKVGGMETIRARYEDAIAFLQGVASGKISLDQPLNAAPQASVGGPAVSRQRKTFSDSNLMGFK